MKQGWVGFVSERDLFAPLLEDKVGKTKCQRLLHLLPSSFVLAMVKVLSQACSNGMVNQRNRRGFRHEFFPDPRALDVLRLAGAKERRVSGKKTLLGWRPAVIKAIQRLRGN
jgi:hypothetical protein